MIPYGRQTIDQADIDAVRAVLESDWLTQGPTIERFEAAVAEYCGARHAVAVSSGTAALHIGAIAAGLAPGRRLWTVPNTFVASANCARYCGADVDFVDIDLDTGNLDVADLAARLERARAEGTLPDMLVPVHFAGRSCDMAAIADLARRYGFMVMEDASHAIGATYRGRPVGACAFSDMAVFSFHPVKIITTAEGGMVMTNSDALARRLRTLRTHGITRDPAAFPDGPDGPWDYAMVDLGLNYRMTDMQAALGLSQMDRIAGFVDRRHALADRYDAALAGLPLHLPRRDGDLRSALHLYVVRVDAERTNVSRKAVFEHLMARGIRPQVHYIPVHTQPYYRNLGFRPGQFPRAEAHYAQALSLPLYPRLAEADQDRVIAALCEVLG
ncbi:MAG: UDP-4-amino-4,6-dideoxy-N-acetyl-beta-L-altrosamine transaminase [Rhodobacterales bacterium]|nr:UDP-4-amino-4,6-dideoxy-N-acetyl-beta-L-altrosamine transaminase [Rhodobacterales bacterium]